MFHTSRFHYLSKPAFSSYTYSLLYLILNAEVGPNRGGTVCGISNAEH